MFNLNSYLKNKQNIINSALDLRMSPETSHPSLLHKIMRYNVFPGGKRLRPILAIAAAEAVNAQPATKDIIMGAISVELLHSYTLIHDDLPCMDNDSSRRGKPTSHIAFGEANAILAGDALQALAFEIAAEISVPLPYTPNQISFELAHSAGSNGVVGGQFEDVAINNKEPSVEVIEYIHTHKTAALFRVAMRIGAIISGAGKEHLQSLTVYGQNLGLAFQITDDILDSRGSDLNSVESKHNEATCLSIYNMEEAKVKANELIKESISVIKGMNSQGVLPLTAIARYIAERDF